MKKIKQFTLPLFLSLLVAISGCPKEAPKVGGGDGDICPNAKPITETPANKGELVTLINAAITTENPSPDLNHIDVSKVTNMKDLFKGKGTFNGDISCWDTRNVTTMEYMFYTASAFNGDISKWDTHNVNNMTAMFTGASAFNRNIATTGNHWNTSKVTSMSRMFENAASFNQDLTSWDVSSITLGHSIFAYNAGFATETGKHPKWCDNVGDNRHANCSP